jgi:maltose O-acetyltransferase
MNLLEGKIRRKLYGVLIYSLQWPRVAFYRLLSWNRPLNDEARRRQPVLLLGDGEIRLGRCHLGVWPSPYLFSGYAHIEARTNTSSVHIADGVWINNNAVIIAERCRISIGKNTLIGTEFTVYDSDFHDLHPDRRLSGVAKTAPVTIGENVFIGSRVSVMKGVTIGDNSVIASGSVVTVAIPRNCIAAGVPARVVAEAVVAIGDKGQSHV